MSEQGLTMLPWFPGDFMKATRGWPLVARGLYRELLDAQWEMGPLPNDLDELATIAGAKPDEFAAGWSRVRTKFIADAAGRLVNLKLEQHRERSERLRDSAARRGSLGGLAKAAKNEKPSSASSPGTSSASGSAIAEGVAEGVAKSCPPTPTPTPALESCNSTLPLSLTPSGAQIPRAVDESKKPASDVQRGTRIPLPFFVTDDMRAWAQVEAPNVDVRKATAEFEDYWRAVPGAKGRKSDWPSTWRNRMREQQGRAAQQGKRLGGTDQPTTKHDRIVEALRNG